MFLPLLLTHLFCWKTTLNDKRILIIISGPQYAYGDSDFVSYPNLSSHSSCFIKSATWSTVDVYFNMPSSSAMTGWAWPLSGRGILRPHCSLLPTVSRLLVSRWQLSIGKTVYLQFKFTNENILNSSCITRKTLRISNTRSFKKYMEKRN